MVIRSKTGLGGWVLVGLAAALVAPSSVRLNSVDFKAGSVWKSDGLSIKQRNPVVNEGGKVRLTATDPSGNPVGDARWSSGSPDIAAVDPTTGEVSGIEQGFATVTATRGADSSSVFVAVARVKKANGEKVPGDLKADRDGRLYISNPVQNVILRAPRALASDAQVYAGTRGMRGMRNGMVEQALFAGPTAMGIDQGVRGGLYVADTLNHGIRKIGFNRQVETVLGTGSPGLTRFDAGGNAAFEEVRLNAPRGTATDLGGNLFVADTDNHAIYYADLAKRRVVLLAGKPGESGQADGDGRAARFSRPAGLALDSTGRVLAVADRDNNRVRLLELTKTDGGELACRVTTLGTENRLAGTSADAVGKSLSFEQPSSVSFDGAGNLNLTDATGAYVVTRALGEAPEVVALAQAGTFTQPSSVTVGGTVGFVLDAGGQDAEQVLNQVTVGAPEITGLNVSSVRIEGGEEVVVTGKNFAPESKVVIGEVVIANTMVESATQIRFRMPRTTVPGNRTLTVLTRGGLAQRNLTVVPKSLAELSPGEITTVGGGSPNLGDGGSAAVAVLSAFKLTIDGQGNLYAVEPPYGTARIRRIDGQTGIVTTIAGNGSRQFVRDGVPAVGAGIGPTDAAVDSAGNLIVADTLNDRIRRVDARTNVIQTIALSGTEKFGGDGGPATAAGGEVYSVAVDTEGNLYFSDLVRVRRVDAKTGIVRTIAGTGKSGSSGDGGPATKAEIHVRNILLDASGNIFIAGVGTVRRIDAATGIITRFAGSGSGLPGGGDGGSALQASIEPFGLAFDADGNLLIADGLGFRIRKVDKQSGIITTVAGNGRPGFDGDGGPATNASISPFGIVADGNGNIFLADGKRIRRIDGRTGIITTIAGGGQSELGDGGPAIGANFVRPSSVAVTPSGDMVVSVENRVLKIDGQVGTVTTIAGTGEAKAFGGDGVPAASAPVSPLGVAVDSEETIYFADRINARVRKVDSRTGILSTVAGNGAHNLDPTPGPATQRPFPGAFGLGVSNGKLYVANGFFVQEVEPGNNLTRTLAEMPFENGLPTGAFQDLAVDSDGNILVTAHNNSEPASLLFRVDVRSGIKTVVVDTHGGVFGGGNESGSFSQPGLLGVAVDGDGNIFIATQSSVFRTDKNGSNPTRIVGTGQFGYAGDGGSASSAELSSPRHLAIDQNGNLYIADFLGDAVRVVKGIAVPPKGGGSDTKVTITGASFSNNVLTITGTGFGASGARLFINDKEMTAPTAGQNDSRIVMNGSRKKLNLKPGANRIMVSTGSGTSNIHVLNL